MYDPGTGDPQYAGSRVFTLNDVVRNTITLDAENAESPRNLNGDDTARYWKQYVDDDGLSEYSEYDIDDFVYRTTSYDKAEK